MAKKKTLEELSEQFELTDDYLQWLTENEELVQKELLKQLKKDPEKAMDFMRAFGRMADRPVTAAEWAKTHPFMQACGSDYYYATLATELNEKMWDLPIDPTLPQGTLREASRSIAAYLEDLVSGTGIWAAVRRIYQQRYGRILPFYDVDSDDYFEDDLNIEDIRLLVWQAFCRCGQYEDRIFSPVSDAVYKISDLAFDILVDRFDSAPRAQRAANTLKQKLRDGDYFQLRTLGLWLTADCPLTAAPFMRQDMDRTVMYQTDDFRRKNPKFDINYETVYYYLEAESGWCRYISMDGCGSNVILAEMAREAGCKKTAEDLDSVKVYENVKFSVKNAQGAYVLVEDQLGKEFRVRKNSFGKDLDWEFIKSGEASFVRFGDHYMQNGVAAFSEKPLPAADGKIYLKEISDNQLALIEETVNDHDGRRVFYCKSLKEVSAILSERLKPIPPEGIKNGPKAKNFALMLSGIEGPKLFPDDCRIFADPENRYYKSGKKTGDEALEFIGYSDLADDVIDYIVEHKLLPDAYLNASQGYETGLRIVQDNLGFLMRFMRVDAYPHPNVASKEDPDDDDL